jgi:hypothetical protein
MKMIANWSFFLLLTAMTINAADLTIEGDLDVQGDADVAGSLALPYNGGFYSKQIDVAGDADTYYPVVFNSRLGGDGRIHDVFVFRSYKDPAPNSWNTTTHTGALSLHLRIVGGSWGGIPTSLEVLRHEYLYATQFADAQLTDHGKMLTLWLRGGGARYKIAGTLPNIVAPTIAYTSTLMHNYSNDAYDDYVEPINTVKAPLVNPRILQVANGKVGIGTNAPAHELDVNGNTHISGNLTVDGFIHVDPQGDISMGIFTNTP